MESDRKDKQYNIILIREITNINLDFRTKSFENVTFEETGLKRVWILNFYFYAGKRLNFPNVTIHNQLEQNFSNSNSNNIILKKDFPL